MAENSPQPETQYGKAWLFGFFAVCFVTFLVPLVLASVLFLTLRQTVRNTFERPKRLYLAALLVGAIASAALTLSSWDYFKYVIELAISRFFPEKLPNFSPFGDFPYLEVVAYTTFIYGAAGLVSSKLVHVSPKLAQALHLADDNVDTGEVIPDERTRAEIVNLVSFPQTSGPKIGKKSRQQGLSAYRDENGVGVVPLGYDAAGRVVSLYEPDITVHGQVLGSTGSGKAIWTGTPIPTPSGWTTMGELKVGDLIFDEKGKPTRVVFATEVMYDHECFEVEFSDGSVIIADADHLWLVEDRKGRFLRNKRKNNGGVGYGPWQRRYQRFLEKLVDIEPTLPKEATLQELIKLIGHDKLVYTAVRSCNVEPLYSQVRLIPHQYGERTVKKRHTSEVFSVPEVLNAIRDVVEERIASHQPMPVERVVTTKEISKEVFHNGARNWAIRVAEPLQLPARDLPVDPYLLGCWLGDGVSGQGQITSADPEILAAFDAQYTRGKVDKPSGEARTVSYLGLSTDLRKAGVLTNKHIPAEYLRASYEQRLALLQGLLDTDGSIDPKQGFVEFSTSFPELAEGFQELLGTLGIQARLRRGEVYLNGERRKDRYRFVFTTDLPVFRLPRKAQYLPERTRISNKYRFVTAIRLVESVPVRCIQVDSPSHLYLAGKNFIPTHNTETLKRIIAGLLDLGWDGTIIDLKEDIGRDGLGQWVEAYARSHTIPFQSWAMSLSNFRYYLNPLDGLEPDLALDAIIATQEFENPHWAAQAQTALGQLLTILYSAHEVAPEKFPVPTLKDVARMLAGDIAANTRAQRAELKRTLVASGQMDEDEYAAISNPTQTIKEAANGMAARIGRIFESELGRTGLVPGPGRSPLDVVGPGVVYIGLDQLGRPHTSTILATLLLQRFSALASESKHAEVKRRRFVIVDEAATANRDLMKNLLQRARSAGVSLIVATQSAMDWEDDWGTLVQNINWTLAMRQNEPESATMVADLIGKRVVQVEHTSQRIDQLGIESGGTISRREEEKYLVEPQSLRDFKAGESVLYVGNRHNSMKAFVSYCRIVRRPADELPDSVDLEVKPADSSASKRQRVGDVWEYPDFAAGTPQPEITPFPAEDNSVPPPAAPPAPQAPPPAHPAPPQRPHRPQRPQHPQRPQRPQGQQRPTPPPSTAHPENPWGPPPPPDNPWGSPPPPPPAPPRRPR